MRSLSSTHLLLFLGLIEGTVSVLFKYEVGRQVDCVSVSESAREVPKGC